MWHRDSSAPVTQIQWKNVFLKMLLRLHTNMSMSCSQCVSLPTCIRNIQSHSANNSVTAGSNIQSSTGTLECWVCSYLWPMGCPGVQGVSYDNLLGVFYAATHKLFINTFLHKDTRCSCATLTLVIKRSFLGFLYSQLHCGHTLALVLFAFHILFLTVYYPAYPVICRVTLQIVWFFHLACFMCYVWF